MNGATGASFFTPLPSAAGAARPISVSAGIVADPGNDRHRRNGNSGGQRLSPASWPICATHGSLSGGTATLSDAWGSLVYRVGADTKSASDEQSSRAEIVQQVELLARAGLGRVARRRSDDDDEVPARVRSQRAFLPGDRFGARYAVVAAPVDPRSPRRPDADHIQFLVPSERCGPVADVRGACQTAAGGVIRPPAQHRQRRSVGGFGIGARAQRNGGARPLRSDGRHRERPVVGRRSRSSRTCSTS